MEVEGLGRKLRLLVEQAHFDDWNDLAKAFDRNRSTVYGWGHGRQGMGLGNIPNECFEKLIDILHSCLPHLSGRPAARQLALAPLAQFEQELTLHEEHFWHRIIKAEAVSGSGQLFIKPEKKKAGLVVSDKQRQEPFDQIIVRLKQWFRLEFNTKAKSGYVCAMQNAAQSWGGVEADFNKKTGIIRLPGYRTDGKFAHINEPLQTDLHRFIVLLTPKPPPTEFQRYLIDTIELDGTILRNMANFYCGQPKGQRRLYLFELQVTK